MAQKFSLKDHLFNPDTVSHLAGLFAQASPAFDVARFEADVFARLNMLELKERIDWLAQCLAAQLPDSLPAMAPILRQALPPALDPTKTDDDFGHFIHAPFGNLVVQFGLEEHPQLSLDLIEDITQRFTMEYAIRPFLNRWPEETLTRLQDWAAHPNYHVRRLVSEGTRPKLPWATAVDVTPAQTLPLLTALHADPTRYVTRSVANHLNDHSKRDPALVLDTLAAWKQAGRQAPDELAWMTRHALRTLVKQGHAGAMEMLGYSPDPDITLAQLTLSPPQVEIGASVEITLELTAARDEPVILDYVLHTPRSSGKVSQKTYKFKDLTLKAGAQTVLTKAHRFKGDATTFRLHPGPCRLVVQANGKTLGEVAFDLTA